MPANAAGWKCGTFMSGIVYEFEAAERLERDRLGHERLDVNIYIVQFGSGHSIMLTCLRQDRV